MSTSNTNTAAKVLFPATRALAQTLIAHAKSLGYTIASADPTTESGLKENGGYAFLRFEGTHEMGASIIIPKAVGRLTRVHSHVDLSAFSGYIPLPKKNGKVICHFSADADLLKAVLPQFLSAAKRATAVATPKVASQAPVVQPVEWSQFDMPASEEETEEAMVELLATA